MTDFDLYRVCRELIDAMDNEDVCARRVERTQLDLNESRRLLSAATAEVKEARGSLDLAVSTATKP